MGGWKQWVTNAKSCCLTICRGWWLLFGLGSFLTNQIVSNFHTFLWDSLVLKRCNKKQQLLGNWTIGIWNICRLNTEVIPYSSVGGWLLIGLYSCLLLFSAEYHVSVISVEGCGSPLCWYNLLKDVRLKNEAVRSRKGTCLLMSGIPTPSLELPEHTIFCWGKDTSLGAEAVRVTGPCPMCISNSVCLFIGRSLIMQCCLQNKMQNVSSWINQVNIVLSEKIKSKINKTPTKQTKNLPLLPFPQKRPYKPLSKPQNTSG